MYVSVCNSMTLQSLLSTIIGIIVGSVMVCYLCCLWIPEMHQELFALLRLADSAGCEEYLSAAAKWLETTVDNIRNINGTHQVLYFVRGIYRAARHHRAKSCRQGSGLCYICLRPFDVPIYPLE